MASVFLGNQTVSMHKSIRMLAFIKCVKGDDFVLILMYVNNSNSTAVGFNLFPNLLHLLGYNSVFHKGIRRFVTP